MGQIFLSYAREDRACAECLARVLEGAGHNVWWDRRIDGGEEFAAEIEAQLDKADAVLVAWSKDSVKSRWVRDEAGVGGDTGRLIPVSVDGSLPPMGFRQFHSLDLIGWKGGKRDERTAQLLHSVEKRLGKNFTEVHAPKLERRFRLANRRAMWVIASMILIVVAAGAMYFLSNRFMPRAVPLKPTIAVLPFTADSSDAELDELASQSRDSLAHTFSQSGLPLRLVQFATSDPKSPVDFTISGDFSRSADKILATIRLDEVAHGVTVFSHRFEAGREEVRDLPERIGAQMAGNLTWASPLMMLDRREPLDPALLADLLQGSDFTNFGTNDLQTYQNSVRAAAKAPNVRIAQIAKAFNTAFVIGELPRGDRPEAVVEARRAAERAMALGSDFGDTYATFCLLRSETLLAQCEDRLRAGKRVDPDAPFVNTFLSHLLRNVGRFEEAMDLARLAYTHDVYVPTKIAWMLKSMEYAGEDDAARDLYIDGGRWWPEYKPMFFRNRLFGLIDGGDFAGIQRLETEVGAEARPADYVSSDALAAALRSRSVSLARRACPDSEDFFLNLRCMIALASLGDQNAAYAIADKLYPRRVGRTSAETERIWLDDPAGNGPLEFVTSPGAAPLRRDPRYVALAQRTGLLDYWRSGRPPDFCRKQPEPICKELLKR